MFLPSCRAKLEKEQDPEGSTSSSPTHIKTVNPKITTNASCLGNSDGGRAAALVTLSRDNLVVVGAEVHSMRSPSIEVVGGGHGTAGTLAAADGPVLVEGRSALDGGLVDLLVLIDIVGGTVTGNSTLVGHARARVVGTVVLQDVVLDERASSPAVNGEVSIARRVEGSGEVDVPENEETIC